MDVLDVDVLKKIYGGNDPDILIIHLPDYRWESSIRCTSIVAVLDRK